MSETVALEVTPFSIKTEVFEGPLELLLELVEKRKLLINDISLAAVTDEYLATVSSMQERSLPHTTQFVQLAATLLLIKSKSLLPVLELTEDEESAIENLEARLKRYQIFRDASTTVTQVFGKNLLYEKKYILDTKPMLTLDQFTELPVLADSMYQLISSLPQTEKKPKVTIRTIISLEEMIDRLHQRVASAASLTFRELLEHDTEKKVVIVGFLAILESVKQGSVLVAQAERYQDIHIEQSIFTTPKY